MSHDSMCTPSGGPCGQDLGACEGANGICKGGKDVPNHITVNTELYQRDRNRWKCRKSHDSLCGPCFESPTCPVHGHNFGLLPGQR